MKIFVLTLLIINFSLSFLNGQSRKDSLIVFVGEKLALTEKKEEKSITILDTIISGLDTTFKEHHQIISDFKYVAKYKVLELINGYYDKDTIEFIVFDHYGEPSFSKYRTVLLFVSYHEDNFYHEKYQYFPLFMTLENRWASPYSYKDFNHQYKNNITVRPEKVEFKEEVGYYISDLSPDELYKWFPIPYYQIQNGKAIAMYGNYTHDLFKLKQETVMKARGLY